MTCPTLLHTKIMCTHDWKCRTAFQMLTKKLFSRELCKIVSPSDSCLNSLYWSKHATYTRTCNETSTVAIIPIQHTIITTSWYAHSKESSGLTLAYTVITVQHISIGANRISTDLQRKCFRAMPYIDSYSCGPYSILRTCTILILSYQHE